MSRGLVFSAGLGRGGDPEGFASLREHGRHLARLYPLWYLGGGSGPDFRMLADPAQRRRVAELCAASGTELWPRLMVPASDFRPNPSSRGTDPWLEGVAGDGSDAADGPLWESLRAEGAKGLCLDPGPLPADPGNAEALFVVVRELGKALWSAGFKLALVARLGDESTPVPLAWGGTCDILRVPLFRDLALDPTPGPLASEAWLGAVLDRTLSLAAADKIEVVLPVGAVWMEGGGEPEGLPYAAWAELVAAHPPERRDPSSREVWLKAGGREAWTNDAISLSAKLWEARQRGISQASLWRLGPEDPRWWAFLDALPEAF